MAPLLGYAFAEPALKYLETAVPPKIRGQIRRRVEALLNDPTPPGSKKLQGVMDGANSVYRVRQGDYRILYVVRENPNQIVVLDIDHRKDVYR